MAIPLYDISVTSFLQTLGGVTAFLEKGLQHCQAQGIDPQEIVDTRLYPDMLPFHFQVVAVAHHSWGALQGVQAGVFSPPSSPTMDYAGLQNYIAEARAGLQALSRDAVDALEGKDVIFKLGEHRLPFTAEGFLLSFSIPNLHFHATTAYDILRTRGVALSKRDYMGQMRMKG